MMCLPCFLFASETSGVSGKYRYSKEWSEDGISNWKKGLEKLYEHEKSESHQICSEKLENLQCGVPIDEVIDRQRALATQKSHEKILRNKAILSRVIELVELFARQNISFRGHREDSESLNRGNFIEFLHHQARYDPLLNEHLFSGARNAQYITKSTQNELISLCAEDIREQILNLQTAAKYYTLICDETKDISCVEQASIVLRYVTEDTCEPTERFMGYKPLEVTNAESIKC